MNAPKKQVGDRVLINAGQHKGKTGVIVEKEPHGLIVELDDATRIKVIHPMITAVENSTLEGNSSQPEQTSEQTEKQTIEVESSEPNPSEPAPESEPHPEQNFTLADAHTTVAEALTIATSEPESNQLTETAASEDVPQELAKLNMKALKALAKQHGIGIARTKADFLRIIKEKNPEEDLEHLKSRVLFDRVSELHISRLRSKRDLVIILSGKVSQ